MRIKTIEVGSRQLDNILAFEQCRLTLTNIQNSIQVDAGDSVVFICDGKTACAYVSEVIELNIQDTSFEDMYDEGIRTGVPDILKQEPQMPVEYDTWSKDKQDEYIRSTARVIYMAQCKLAQDMQLMYKIYWDSLITGTNFESLRYDANPTVKAIKFEVM